MSLRSINRECHSRKTSKREEFVEELAKLITAGAWGLVAVTLATGIPFAWRKVLAYIEAKTQLSLAEAVRRMLDE